MTLPDELRVAPDELTELNDKLKSHGQFGDYTYIKAIVVYWSRGDNIEVFQKEGEELGRFLEGKFAHDVEYFAIPFREPHIALRDKIIRIGDDLDRLVRDENGRCLLILHYGGHGDENNDSKAGEERRSVWRPDLYRDVKVEWYQIQQQFAYSKMDVLMILDCCFAAQAARGSANSMMPGRIELLAAAPMGQGTPLPGPGSFTAAVRRVLQRSLEKSQSITTDDLIGRLTHRREDLAATPVRVPIRNGSGYSIRLKPIYMARGGEEESESREWKSSVRLRIRTTAILDSAQIEQLVRWLHADAPDDIADIRAEEVLSTTSAIGQYIRGDLEDRQKPLVRGVGSRGLDTIQKAWLDIQGSVDRYEGKHLSDQQVVPGGEHGHSQAQEFIEELDRSNAKVLEVLDEGAKTSAAVSGPEALEDLVNDPSASSLGIKDKLVLRQIIQSPAAAPVRSEIANSAEQKDVESSRIEEYKEYGEGASKRELDIVEARVDLLARLLSTEKRAAFSSLKLRSYRHDFVRRRFVYSFDPPDGLSAHHSLFDAMSPKHTAGKRPSLGDRFALALATAQAVQHWHSVDWVHQGISSRNIIIFEDAAQNIKWRSPYLQGFEFARPNGLPSVARYTEDIENDVYRHPDRLGVACEGHRKTHDLYALGVVLLEIGLWQHAIDMIRDRKGKLGQLTAVQVASKLKADASSRLAHYMGRNYADACLCCLKGDFGVELDDARGSRLAAAVQERVLDKITPRKDLG